MKRNIMEVDFWKDAESQYKVCHHFSFFEDPQTIASWIGKLHWSGEFGDDDLQLLVGFFLGAGVGGAKRRKSGQGQEIQRRRYVSERYVAEALAISKVVPAFSASLLASARHLLISGLDGPPYNGDSLLHRAATDPNDWAAWAHTALDFVARLMHAGVLPEAFTTEVLTSAKAASAHSLCREEHREDPELGGRAVTFSEMCRGHARCDVDVSVACTCDLEQSEILWKSCGAYPVCALCLEKLTAHWANLKVFSLMQLVNCALRTQAHQVAPALPRTYSTPLSGEGTMAKPIATMRRTLSAPAAASSLIRKACSVGTCLSTQFRRDDPESKYTRLSFGVPTNVAKGRQVKLEEFDDELTIPLTIPTEHLSDYCRSLAGKRELVMRMVVAWNLPDKWLMELVMRMWWHECFTR